MSFPSDVVHALANLWKNQVLLSQSGFSRTSIVLPAEEDFISPMEFSGFRITSNYFLPSNFTTIDAFDFGGSNVPAYPIGEGFYYISDDMAGAGAFFFQGDPGLFDIGFSRLNVTDSNGDYLNPENIYTDVTLFDPVNMDQKVVRVNSHQHAQLYVTNPCLVAMFANFVNENSPENYQIVPGTELVITRLSKNIVESSD